jgi:preprotein translocase subunit Sss1
MKVNKGWKDLYKKLSRYNRQRFIEANRPFGKDSKEFIKMLIWFLAGLFIIGIALIIGR